MRESSIIDQSARPTHAWGMRLVLSVCAGALLLGAVTTTSAVAATAGGQCGTGNSLTVCVSPVGSGQYVISASNSGGCLTGQLIVKVKKKVILKEPAMTIGTDSCPGGASTPNYPLSYTAPKKGASICAGWYPTSGTKKEKKIADEEFCYFVTG